MQQSTIPHYIDATALGQFINKLLPTDIATAPPGQSLATRAALASFTHRTQTLEQKKKAEDLTDADVKEEPRSCLMMIAEADTPLRTCSLIWIDRRDEVARVYSPGTEELREWMRLVADTCSLSSRRILGIAFHSCNVITEEDHTDTSAAIDADNLSLAAIAAQLLLGVSSNPAPPLPEEIGVWRELVHALCSTDMPCWSLPRLAEDFKAEVGSWGFAAPGETARTASTLLRHVAKVHRRRLRSSKPPSLPERQQEAAQAPNVMAFHLEGLLRRWSTGL